MVQFHKLAAIGLAVTLSSVGNVFALGLGEVTWKSSLNQPLDAEIAVYDAHNVTNKELVVKIASDEDFRKAGLDKPFVLTDLVFTPIIKGNGKGIIKITSKQPIKEPYLDFLLSVTWASGQTLREYTLLIDPPAYTPPAAAIPVKKTVKSADKPIKKTAVQAVKPPKRAPLSNVEGKTVKAFRGSSLWLLAERSRSGVSVQQAMLAIYEANPDAFIDGKMSLLKEGAILRIPSGDQMRKATRAEAESQVLANVTGKVSPTVAPRQVLTDGTNQTPAATDMMKDQLKLAGVSENAGNDTDPKSSSSLSSVGLKDKIAQTAEELDAVNSNNNELRSRLSDLQSRLDDMKRLVELKNDQLAALQANIGSQHQASLVDDKPVVDDNVLNEQEIPDQAASNPDVDNQAVTSEQNTDAPLNQDATTEQGLSATEPAMSPVENEVTLPVPPAQTNNSESPISQ